MFRRLITLQMLLLVSLSGLGRAVLDDSKDGSKEPSGAGLVMFWPNQENAVLKLTFGRFQNLATYAGKMTLVSSVVVQNVSTKAIPKASFSVSLLDKERIRVGTGTLVVDDLNAGDAARVQFQCESTGPPAVLSISARNDGGAPVSLKTIAMTVISIPAGASLKIDAQDQGLTPARINVGIGTHQLELKKEGFAVAITPLEVAPDEAPGGSITITLGGLTDDTIELRDGSILTGEVVSMSLDSVALDIQGQVQKLDRNRVKKIFLVERIVTTTSGAQEPAKKKAAAVVAPSHP